MVARQEEQWGQEGRRMVVGVASRNPNQETCATDLEGRGIGQEVAITPLTRGVGEVVCRNRSRNRKEQGGWGRPPSPEQEWGR